MTKPLEIVTLKNGSTETRLAVVATYANLRRIIKAENYNHTKALALSVLVDHCRDPQCPIEPEQRECLQQLGLLQQDGTVHTTIKNIIVCAVVGEGFELYLQNPMKPTDPLPP